jgi:hypothetical protein
MRDAVTLNAAFAIAAFKADFHLPLKLKLQMDMYLPIKQLIQVQLNQFLKNGLS